MSADSYAVIAGEIADSRRTDRDHLGRIPDIIREAQEQLNQYREKLGQLDFEIIRMDEFLCFSNAPSSSLRMALMLAAAFRSHSQRTLNIRTGLRLSIGIGPVELLREQLRESDGTAFRYADHGLRTMRRNQRLVIQTEDNRMNGEFAVACGFMDSIIQGWSDEQAEAVVLSLAGMNQVHISEVLNISQPAVNRRLKSAGLDPTERFLDRFESLLKIES